MKELVGIALSCGLLAHLFVKSRKFSSKIEVVATDEAPAAIGPYVQAVKDSMGTIYVSGQVGFIPGTKTLDGATAAEQAKRCLTNIRAILEAAGSSMDRVLKTTVLLTDIADYVQVNEVYAQAFGEHKPARAAFAVKSLPAGALVEIETIALEK